MRAIAIVAVLAFHAFPALVPGGFVGVDIFFVISGYLISGIIMDRLATGKFSFLDFYQRRIRRLFPALIFVMATCLAGGWLILSPDEYVQLGKHTMAGASFSSNFVLWQETGYFDKFSELKPLLHLWSLGIEEQFYLLWPFLLVLAWRLKLPLLPCLLVLALTSFSLNIYLIHTHAALTFYLPLTRFWELLAGALLAHDVRQKNPSALSQSALFKQAQANAGALLIAVAIIFFNKQLAFPGWWAMVPVLGTVLLIQAGSQTLLNRKLLAHPFMVGVGAISFPLYLWHWPLLTAARLMEGGLPSASLRSFILLISLLLAWLTYRFIESPFRFGRYAKASSAFLLLSGMFVIGLSGFALYYYQGVPQRFPPELRGYLSYDFDQFKDWRSGSCYLYAERATFPHPQDCIESGKGPLVFLWGDSHAAALYPGLKNLQSQHTFRIAQFTSSGCPPAMTWSLPQYQFCPALNEATLALIKQLMPDVVLLHGNWPIGNEAPEKLVLTLRALKAIGIKRIIVMGPVPQWQDPLPRLIMAQWSRIYPRQQPPLRLSVGLTTGPIRLEPIVQAIARQEGGEYISPYQALCNDQGCISHIESEGKSAPLMFDNDHLTPEASVFLMQQLAPALALP